MSPLSPRSGGLRAARAKFHRNRQDHAGYVAHCSTSGGATLLQVRLMRSNRWVRPLSAEIRNTGLKPFARSLSDGDDPPALPARRHYPALAAVGACRWPRTISVSAHRRRTLASKRRTAGPSPCDCRPADDGWRRFSPPPGHKRLARLTPPRPTRAIRRRTPARFVRLHMKPSLARRLRRPSDSRRPARLCVRQRGQSAARARRRALPRDRVTSGHRRRSRQNPAATAGRERDAGRRRHGGGDVDRMVWERCHRGPDRCTMAGSMGPDSPQSALTVAPNGGCLGSRC